MKVFCSYHNESGTCTEEDFKDTKTDINPSGMVRVQFESFNQAVPLHTLTILDNHYLTSLKTQTI